MNLEKIARDILKAVIIIGPLLFCSCSNKYSKAVSKLSSGDVEINYSKLTDAVYVGRDSILRTGMEKPADTFFSSYKLDEKVQGVWVMGNRNYVLISNRAVSPKLRPGDGIEEGFIVPAKQEKGKRICYGFIDDDFKKLLEEKKVSPKLKNIGNKVYLTEIVIEQDNNSEMGHYPGISVVNSYDTEFNKYYFIGIGKNGMNTLRENWNKQ